MELTYKPTYIDDGHGNLYLGTHGLFEVIDADPDALSNLNGIREALLTAAKDIGATVLSDHFHEFSGGGVTGVVILSESHISIHTWPELKYAAIDIFTCGKCDPLRGVDVIGKYFKPVSMDAGVIRRGKVN